jgi:hypothetical protein
MSKLSRRDFIGVGVAAGAAAVFPRKVLAYTRVTDASSQDAAAVSQLVVQPLVDAASASRMNRLFPGLLDDQAFQQVRPVAFLVTNTGKTSIRAFSSHWTIATPAGNSEFSLMHYFHPRAGYEGRKRMHWGITGNRTRRTGRISIIKAGATRLVTPFFNWSPAYYAEHNSPDWNKLLRRRTRTDVNLSALASPDSRVTMTIVAAITRNYSAVGPQSQQLARIFSVTRNAEHDEALSILKRVREGDSAEEVRKLLRKHSSGLAFDIRPESDLYFRVRQRQAKVLLRRSQKARWDQFVRTLEYLRNQPKTVVHPVVS